MSGGGERGGRRANIKARWCVFGGPGIGLQYLNCLMQVQLPKAANREKRFTPLYCLRPTRPCRPWGCNR